MKFKRFLAFAVVATMVAGSTLTAFAEEGVSGTGIIEFDDSTAIKYDQVVVPTVAAATYNMTMDPSKMLVAYGGAEGETFVENKTVYFKTYENRAYIEAKANGALYKEMFAPFPATSGAYPAFATGTVNAETGAVSVTAVEAGKYLWVPDAAYTGSGSSGKYLEITKDNIEKFFDLAASSTEGKLDATFRADHKAGADVCNGVVYSRGSDAIGNGGDSAKAKIVDADNAPLSDYATVGSDGTLTAIKGLYKDATLETAAAITDFDYKAATYHYTDQTDAVYVKNLSTKSKTVTAKVTLLNADGLTISSTDGFTGATDKAAVYVAAYGDATTTPKVLAADTDGVVTTTITATLAGADEDSAITYQTTEQNKFGGHKYKRYSAPGVTYNDNSFYIKAAAAAQTEENKDAWAEYYETATTAPSINIVYTVTNTNAEEEEEEEAETPTAAYATVQQFGSVYMLLVKPSEATTFTGLTAVSGITSFEIKLNDGEYTNVLDKAQVYQEMAGISYTDAVAKVGTMTTGDVVTVKIVIGGVTYVATYTV